MEIIGRRQTYNVKWTQYGWSYAKAFIKVRKKFLGIIPYKKTVRLSTKCPTLLYDAERMFPKAIKEWFTQAIREYEDRLDAWEEEEKSINPKTK